MCSERAPLRPPHGARMQAGSATRRAISSSARAAAAAVADSGLTMAATPAGSGLVRAVLDRPKAMNALTLDMIRAMRPLVDGWTAEAGVSCVMLEGAGEKAFCAGGDIKLLHGGGQESAVKADQEAFFREEYDLDFALSRSLERGAPLVAVCDGITMGGGVGVSIHAPVRIATERYVFSMPETSIGLFPDVGGSFFLPRLPGSVGHCLALTGARVKGPEAVQLGLATHFVESGDLEALTAELAALPAGAGLAGVEEAVGRFAKPTEAPSGLATDAARAAVADVFQPRSGDTVASVVDRARAAAASEAHAALAGRWLKALEGASPTSLCVTHEQLRRGAELSLRDCFAMELRLAVRFMQRPDFYEGVRAAVIDRDGKPAWSPATVEEVLASGDVDAFFAPLAGSELSGGEPLELQLAE